MELAIRFEHPEYLWLLGVVPAVLMFFWMWKRWRSRMMQQAGDVDVVGRLVELRSTAKRRWKAIFTAMGLAFLILSLANFQQGIEKNKVQRKGIDIFLVLDVSKSMWVADVPPDRLENAKRFLWKLLQRLGGDRVGLIIFAGNAYVQVPLTIDYDAVATLLQAVDPTWVPTPGTNLVEAIELARERFLAVHSDYGKAIVIVSDGEDHMGRAEDAAREANKEGIRIYTIGVGTSQGGPVPIIRNGQTVGYKTDKKGQQIISKLHADILRKIAQAGGGRYLEIHQVDELVDHLQRLEKGTFEGYETISYTSYYQYSLALALLFFLLDSFTRESSAPLLDKKQVQRNVP